MPTEPSSDSSQRTWKDIGQAPVKPVKSKSARERKVSRFLNLAAGLSALCLLALGCWGVRVLLQESAHHQVSATAPTRQVEFETDGVLTREWFLQTYRQPLENPLLHLDLQAIQTALLANGQIITAELSVALPDRLKVKLRERQPVLRVRLLSPADGKPTDWLVADDGRIYQGELYPRDMLAGLPYLKGVKLVRSGDRFRPLEYMEPVAELLRTCRLQMPLVYRTFKAVSLEYYEGREASPEAIILIESKAVPELVFSPRDIKPQLERLDGVIEHALKKKMKALRRIDLSFPDKAIVRMDQPGRNNT